MIDAYTACQYLPKMQDIETGRLIQNNKKHRTWSSTGVGDSTKYEEASTGSRGFFFSKLSQA
ncbi:hypothetical protein [Acinetobacter junii]|uniref:hypothetical protein n=1 Tax=Acinetobacter junii TaxID=40215 RepID=UPI00125095A7|nr:hypothetical protein [Acinetobacter junii]